MCMVDYCCFVVSSWLMARGKFYTYIIDICCFLLFSGLLARDFLHVPDWCLCFLQCILWAAG